MSTTTNNTKKGKMEIAQTIAKQIGNKALFMIGAKNLAAGKDYLQFKIGRNSKKVQFVTIKLNGSDLYDIEFSKMNRNYEKTIISNANDVYFDKLNTAIESNTGLYTSL